MTFYKKDGFENYYIKRLFGFLEININLTWAIIDIFIFKKRVAYITLVDGKAVLNIKIIKFIIPIKSFLNKILFSYLNNVISLGEKRKVIAFFDRTGETYINCLHLKEYCIEKKISEYCIITPFAYLVDIIKVFSPGIPIFIVPKIFYQLHFLNKSIVKLQDITIHQILFHTHFIEMEKRIRLGENINFYDAILTRLNLTKKDYYNEFFFSKEIENNVNKKMKLNNLKENEFIILAPEAQSNGSLSDKFWQDLSLYINNNGIDVLFNVTKNTIANQYGKTIYFNLTEAMYIARKAKKIIGIRSGYMDLVSASNKPIYCIYYPFGNRGKYLPYLSASEVFKSYSLKMLPLINEKLITEINGEVLSEEEIFKDVCKFIESC